MKGRRFTATQILDILREANSAPAEDITRKYSLSDAAIHTLRKKYSGLGASEVTRRRNLESKGGRKKASSRRADSSVNATGERK